MSKRTKDKESANQDMQRGKPTRARVCKANQPNRTDGLDRQRRLQGLADLSTDDIICKLNEGWFGFAKRCANHKFKFDDSAGRFPLRASTPLDDFGAAGVCGENFVRACAETLPSRHRSYSFVTICLEIGITDISHSIVDVGAVRKETKKILSSLAPNAIGALQVEIFTKPVFKEKSSRLHLHAHALTWGRARDKMKQIAEDLAIETSLGNRAIDIKKVTKGTETYLAGYFLRAPSYAKNPVYNDRKERYTLKNCLSGYSKRHVFAVRELLGRISLRDSVFALGEGKQTRDRWVKMMKAA